MDVIISHDQGSVPVTVFSVDGDIDLSNHEELERIVFQEIHAGTRHVLFDLSEVPFMSSAGFRTFMRSLNACEPFPKVLARRICIKGSIAVHTNPLI